VRLRGRISTEGSVGRTTAAEVIDVKRRSFGCWECGGGDVLVVKECR